MKLWIYLLVFPIFLWSSSIDLPEKFFLHVKSKKNLLINLKYQEKKIGIITKSPKYTQAYFKFINKKRNLFSKAIFHYYCWGTIVDVFSSDNQKIGWLEEQMFQWFTKPICRIYDQNNHIVAIAKKNYWGSHITIIDAQDPDHTIAKIYRPWLEGLSNNKWTVEIVNTATLDQKKLDPNLLIYAAVQHCDRELQPQFMPTALNHHIFYPILDMIHPCLGNHEIFLKIQIQKQKDQIAQLIQTVDQLPYERKIYSTDAEIEKDIKSIEKSFESFEYFEHFDFELPDYDQIIDLYEAKMFTILAQLHEFYEIVSYAISLICKSNLLEEQKKTIYSLLCLCIDEYKSMGF